MRKIISSRSVCCMLLIGLFLFSAVNAQLSEKKSVFVVAEGSNNVTVDLAWMEGSTCTGNIDISIENSTLVQDGIYQIVFEDTLVRDLLWDIPYTKNFSVIDVTNGAHNVLLDKSSSFGELITVPEIPGIKIMLENKERMDFNADSSSWNNTGIYDFFVRPAYISTALKGTFLPADYRIEFGSPGMKTSTPLGDFESSSVNFEVFNTTNNEEIEFAFQKRDGTDPVFSAFTAGNGTYSDRIYFLEKNEDDSLIVTIQFELSCTGSDSTTRLPGEGDIATIKLNKPFLSNDVAEITIKTATLIDEQTSSLSKEFFLSSNYPNPFNPTTNIDFSIPNQSHVELTVWNTLGEKIATLVNGKVSVGVHKITFEAADLSSGVYFYTLKSGQRRITRKMLLLE